MKKIFYTLGVIFCSLQLLAQAPQRLSYQAVIRNSSNVLMVNAPIKMRLTVLQGSVTGTSVYSELHSTTTNANGVAFVEIGGGSPISGSFATINWGQGIYFLRSETDPSNGTNYTIVGTTQLVSVPYSLYSNRSAQADNGLPAAGNYGALQLFNCNGKIQYSPCLPILTTNPVNAVTANTAISGGNISNDGGGFVTSRGVVWSTVQNPTIALTTRTNNDAGSGAFQSNITGLLPNTTYFIRAYASNSAGTSYGNQLSFRTGRAPLVSTSIITGITANSATGGGNVTDSGSSSVTARGLVWSTSPSPTIALTTRTSNGTGLGLYSAGITGLLPNTLYYVRAYATNSAGTSYGTEQSFRTARLPVLTTTAATGITSNSAISGGNITDSGSARIIARGVIWTSSDVNLSIDLPTKTSNGTGIGAFTSNITGLSPSVTYFARAYATTSVGTAYGETIFFRTAGTQFNPNLTYGTVSDIDKNIYKTIQIGKQTWMAENLRVTRYRNGVTIPNIKDTLWTKNTTGAWCYYNNDSVNNIPYGKLYNGYTLSNTNQICPIGWHVPNRTEWDSLHKFLGGDYWVGAKLMSTDSRYWGNRVSSASNSSGFSAVGSGYRSSNNFTSFGFESVWWSSGSNLHWMISTGDNPANYWLTDLVTSSSGISIRCVMDDPSVVYPPTLTTTSVSGITTNAAVSGGNITSGGGGSVTARGVIWSTSPNPTIALTTRTNNGTGTGSFASNLSGLLPNTFYYVRAYATNAAGTAYGNEISFRTASAPRIPLLTTTAVSSVTLNSAISGGNVTDSGTARVTARGIVWGTTENPTIALTTRTNNGTGNGAFTASMTGLTANTIYYVRAYATNSVGTAYGNQVVFTTGALGTQFNPNLTYGTVTDIDNNTYRTIEIGGMSWMAENLRVTRYQNGVPIPQVTDNTAWANNTTGAWCYYNNDSANNRIYGKLYNGFVVLNTNEICPIGWYVAGKSEWNYLANVLGGANVVGSKMKSTGSQFWSPADVIPTTNSSGFSAVAGGYRWNGFRDMGLKGLWWSAYYPVPNARMQQALDLPRFLSNTSDAMLQLDYGNEFGISIRCVSGAMVP